MTIEREPNYNIAVLCDGYRCNEVLLTYVKEWSMAMEMIKDEGWSTVPKSGRFNHYCPACTEELKNGR